MILPPATNRSRFFGVRAGCRTGRQSESNTAESKFCRHVHATLAPPAQRADISLATNTPAQKRSLTPQSNGRIFPPVSLPAFSPQSEITPLIRFTALEVSVPGKLRVRRLLRSPFLGYSSMHLDSISGNGLRYQVPHFCSHRKQLGRKGA